MRFTFSPVNRSRCSLGARSVPQGASRLSACLRSPARAFSWLILCMGIVTLSLSAYTVKESYSSLPFSDAWIEVSAAAGGIHLLSPAWLWNWHNEHRIPLPKLFLAADQMLFHGRQIFPL